MFTKVLVGLPLYDGKMHVECQKSLKALETWNNREGGSPYCFEIVTVSGTSSLFARNQAASKGSQKIKQKVPYDYYLSIDGDMSFSVDSIIKLVKKYEELSRLHARKSSKCLPIGLIGGAYTGRTSTNSHQIVAGNFDKVAGNIPAEKWIPIETIDCISVDWIGTGFMLVPKDVLEALPYPWFRSHNIILGDEASLTTEDIAICMDVKSQLNRSIWVDCSIRVAHFSH